jgi:hypothetical protein
MLLLYNILMTENIILNQALKVRPKLNDNLGKVVEYSSFNGMEEDEIAPVPGGTERTVSDKYT